ncbi:MAG: DUF4842 domain-containing protein [Prevotella sp.]|jgi:hypothetical protein|nr:DUF4842 domain-containing protein [Prevotella sp.]
MKKIVLLAMLAVVTVSCSNKDDYYDADAVKALEDAKRKASLDFTINKEQTWQMETEQVAKVTNLPADIKATELVIYTANPFADSTATILATTNDLNKALSFQCPSYMTTLYAGCTDAEGNLRVVPFQTADGLVDFSNRGYSVVSAARASRRSMPAYGDLQWTDSYNKRDLADKGWDDQVAVVSGAAEVRNFSNRQEIFETFAKYFAGNNNDRVLHKYDDIRTFYYATVGEGGGTITATPVGSSGVINYKMQLGYFYFEKGQEHSYKTVKKYLFAEEYNKNTKFTADCNSFKLVYYDQNGNASYEFPEGTEVSFFIRVSELNGCAMEWYAEGEANVDRSMYLHDVKGFGDTMGFDWWKEANHAFFFERNGYKFVGLEDWINNFNYQDMVVMIEGNVGDFISVNNTKQVHHLYSFAFEDTKNGDYDMNDVVIEVSRGNQNRVPCLFAHLVALGANDPIKAYFKDRVTGEVHPLFGGSELHELFEIEGFINTPKINYPDVKKNSKLHSVIIRNSNASALVQENMTPQDFYIVNLRTNDTIHTPLSQGLKGTEPYGLCIPTKFAWPKEKVSIVKAYPTFADFSAKVVNGVQDCTDWYTKPVEEETLFYDFGFSIN